MKSEIKNEKLPLFFKPLMWSYRFSQIDTEELKERIIVNTINYGNWKHWQWLARHYGVSRVKKIVEGLAGSEFRPRVLLLAKLLFGIKKLKYATRGDKIKAEKNI